MPTTASKTLFFELNWAGYAHFAIRAVIGSARRRVSRAHADLIVSVASGGNFRVLRAQLAPPFSNSWLCC